MDIRTLCLGILALGDATGYEIKKMVAEGSFSFFSEASYGSIYPALTKLTTEGLIECRQESQSNRPDKKIYSLTEAGRAALEDSLAKDPRPDKNRSEFLASLLFAEAVAPERINSLVQDRITSHKRQIDALKLMRAEEDSPVGQFVLDYGIQVQQAAYDFLIANKGRIVTKL